MHRILRGTLAACFLLTTGALLAQDGHPRAVDVTKLPTLKANSGEGDFQIGPPYANAPELTVRDSVLKGQVVRFTMKSTESLLYPGISKTEPLKIVPYERAVSVYVPAGYQQGTAAPFFVSQDSLGSNIIPTILDNMIADHRLPAMVAIMINSGGSDAQGSERGLEYDTISGGYALFIEKEVIPRVEKEAHVTLTHDADGRMIMGGSSGAACAFTAAWFHPEWYHRVLSYSGTYVNQQWPPNPESPHGAWEYHEHFIPESKPKPIRIWMHVGDNDLRPRDPESTLHNWPLANRKMAFELKAKHYHYQFVWARESGHVDGRVVRQTLPAALEWVWKGYRAR